MTGVLERWIDLSYPGGDKLAPFYIFIGISSFLIGFIVIGALLISTKNSSAGIVVGLLSSVMFFSSGVMHLFIVRNFSVRARVVEVWNKEQCKVSFWRSTENFDGLLFSAADIESIDCRPDPKNARDFLYSLPRQPAYYSVRLHDGRSFEVAGSEKSVQELLDIFSKIRQ